jgi:hypothetical protein
MTGVHQRQDRPMAGQPYYVGKKMKMAEIEKWLCVIVMITTASTM